MTTVNEIKASIEFLDLKTGKKYTFEKNVTRKDRFMQFITLKRFLMRKTVRDIISEAFYKAERKEVL
jgi:hypothetical protein